MEGKRTWQHHQHAVGTEMGQAGNQQEEKTAASLLLQNGQGQFRELSSDGSAPSHDKAITLDLTLSPGQLADVC